MITLIGETALQAGIEKQAEVLNVFYKEVKHVSEPVVVLCVLDGAIWFTGQILTKLDFPLILGSVSYKRYVGETTTANVQYSPPSVPVEGKEVLILDDIYDEGWTVEVLKEICLRRGAKNVASCVLLNKQRNRPLDKQPDFFVHEVGNHFVLGSGLDVDGLYRNLPGILIK